MKRLLTLSGVLMLSVSMLFAETSILIDFNELVDDSDGNNAATSIDFSQYAGSSFSEEDRAAMKTSLFIDNWNVVLNSSARSQTSNTLSQVKAVQSSYLGGVTTMGIRVYFPQAAVNANATIMPPFDIPSMMVQEDQQQGGNDTGSSLFRPTQFDNKGVIKNVGDIKSIAMNIRGLNYPHRVTLLITDFNGKESEVPLGDLKFDGWKTLTWNNPSYIYEVRKRQLSTEPLYPYSIPLIKLKGIRFYKDSQHIGGDFIANIKDITVTYDKAVRDDVAVDIDDETVWGILSARENTRREQEMRNFAERQILDFIEAKLVDTSTPSTFSADGNRPVNNRVNTPAAGGQ
jgi:hypothetical protein